MNTVKTASASFPALEVLEPRQLLSATIADWSGTWKVNGLTSDADERYNASTDTSYVQSATLSEQGSVTLTLQGDGSYLLQTSKSLGGEQFTMTPDGDTLLYHRVSSGDNKESFYLRLVPIGPNAAVYINGSGGYALSDFTDLKCVSGSAGLATRGTVPVTARPWTGTYDVTTYTLDAGSHNAPLDVTFTSESFEGQFTDLGKGAFRAQKVAQPDQHIDLKAKGDYLGADSKEATSTGDGFDYLYTRVYRGPDDTLYMIDGDVCTSADNTQLYGGTFAVSVLDPKVGSEYKPDLTVDLSQVVLPDLVMPGQSIKMPIIICNIGTAPASGRVTIALRAIPQDGSEPKDLPPLTNISLNLPANTWGTIKATIPVPPGANWGTYAFEATIDSGNTMTEIDESNNTATTIDTTDLVWRFGNVATEKSVALSAVDADGTVAVFTLTGKGTGQVMEINGRLTLSLAQTDSASRVSVAVKAAAGNDGVFNLQDILVGDAGNAADRTSLGKLTAPAMSVQGDIAITGDVKSLQLFDLLDSTVTIGPASSPTSAAALHFHVINNSSITSLAPLASLTAVQWIDSDDQADLLQAPWIGTLTVAGQKAVAAKGIDALDGDFAADIELTGRAKLPSLGTTSIAGSVGSDVRATRWSIAGATGGLTVKGTLKDTTIWSDAAMGANTFGAMIDSQLLAGTVLGDALPAGAAGFVAGGGKIASLRITGLTGQPKTQAFFIGNSIAATGLGAVTIVNGQFDPKGTFWLPQGSKVTSIRNTDLATPASSWSWPPSGKNLFAGPADLFQWLV